MSEREGEKRSLADAVADMFYPKTFPRDLALLLIWLIIAVLTIYIPGINQTFVRVIFAIPVILFIPGYAFIAALFPQKHTKAEGFDEDAAVLMDDKTLEEAKKHPYKPASGIGGIERFALSVGLSIAIAPLIGFVLNFTPFGIRLDPVLVSITLFTVIMVLIALFRRARLPEDERFRVHFERIKPAIREEMFPAKQTRFDKILSILVIIAIVSVIGVVIYINIFPLDGEKFTEFYILGKDKMAENYPDHFAAGTSQFVWVGVGNHEYRNITYTVDTVLVNASWDSVSNSTVIHASKPLDRFVIPVENGKTEVQKYNFTVNDKEYNRMEFLLYNESVPMTTVSIQDKINSSYRDLHLWITVV